MLSAYLFFFIYHRSVVLCHENSQDGHAKRKIETSHIKRLFDIEANGIACTIIGEEEIFAH